MSVKYIAEPFRIKMVEPLRILTREEREAKLAEARYNMFNLKGEDCYIDLLTDSGTNAMSQNQWSAMMRGDEAYAGASSYFRLQASAKEIFGFEYIQPTHQGRAAEKVLMPLFMGEGKYAISNLFFDTTRAHIILSGGRPLDCVDPRAKDPALRAKFKGNMDLEAMERCILEHGADKIGVVVLTVTNNGAGGQPVSMENIRQVSQMCKKYSIPLNIDAARYAENAFFIKRDEEGYAHKSIREIVKEMFSYADTFTMSSKKDAIVNMGGLIGVKDGSSPLIPAIKSNCINFEGFVTYGGLNGRDLDALAVGLQEGVEDDYLKYRIGQMEYMAARLDDAGIAYQSPVGGHGVFVDGQAMFPHIPYTEFPAHVLAVELYKEAGIRSCEIGSFMLGNDPDTNEQLKATAEFTRLAIPRRVYTQAHLDVICDALINIKARAHEIKHGYRITWEPPIMRHFQAFLEPIK
ncbi:tryptophanase [Pseudoflavonifractor sp. 524-17]|uniref:tryptophanase n=1 Tax=Pseudoflavonifractor sp. 524-17 TaxID=2304577 RepID=UPI00137A3F2E|nr:tryptophanase [Pseudoflavonifractor sp. 524-17]NCE64550.1 tryptophanase [Pseudoflavonifractor sp. 524-17]